LYAASGGRAHPRPPQSTQLEAPNQDVAGAAGEGADDTLRAVGAASIGSSPTRQTRKRGGVEGAGPARISSMTHPILGSSRFYKAKLSIATSQKPNHRDEMNKHRKGIVSSRRQQRLDLSNQSQSQ
jgi:hypothetical protein